MGAFNEHQPADDAQKHHIGQADGQINLAQGTQQLEQPHPKRGAHKAPHGEDRPHHEIHIVPTHVSQHAGDGGRYDLIGPGAHRHRRRHADEDQKRGGEKAAAHPKHPRQQPHPAAHGKDQQNIDGHFRDGQVNLHLGLFGTTLREL